MKCDGFPFIGKHKLCGCSPFPIDFCTSPNLRAEDGGGGAYTIEALTPDIGALVD